VSEKVLGLLYYWVIGMFLLGIVVVSLSVISLCESLTANIEYSMLIQLIFTLVWAFVVTPVVIGFGVLKLLRNLENKQVVHE